MKEQIIKEKWLKTTWTSMSNMQLISLDWDKPIESKWKSRSPILNKSNVEGWNLKEGQHTHTHTHTLQSQRGKTLLL
jgi:hypothetical protein